MEGNLGTQVIRLAKTPADIAATSDAITTICDMGTCAHATAVIAFTYATSSDITDVAFWTSTSDTCGVASTAQVASTNTVQVQIVSDADHLVSKDTSNNNVSDLTVSSYYISSIAASGVTVVDLPNIRRYLFMQYNQAGDAGVGTADLGVVFIGRDGQEQPDKPPTRTAY